MSLLCSYEARKHISKQRTHLSSVTVTTWIKVLGQLIVTELRV